MKKAKKVAKHYLLNPRLIREAKRFLGARTETETIEKALEETIHRARFERMLKQSAGKYRFKGFTFGKGNEQG
ncbi:MAG: hypothetical protein HY693_05000 [Deltaproteobacteria bacterium]|nr:hypothetical protein [Deltaproteobacteria bacterium]